MIDIEALQARYGSIQALHGISLQVRQGEIVTLLGANGAGKTTLLHCLCGIHLPAAGKITLHGENITTAPPHLRVRKGIALSPEGRQIFAALTVEENCRMGAYARRDGEIAADLEMIYELFPLLKAKRLQQAGSLSGGQQQMLALARALMARPKLLLLDEPSMGLAPKIIADIFAIIQSLQSKGMTILLVEQNIYAALSIAERAYVLEQGHIALQGEASALLTDPRIKQAYLGS